MNRTDSLRARMRALCEELGPDDGLTEDEVRKRTRDPRTNRSRRLAGPVARALRRALAASSDPVLQQVWVVDCAPDPDARRFRVMVAPLSSDGAALPLLPALERARGWLRTEVAQELRRKRAPELRFAWSEPEGVDP